MELVHISKKDILEIYKDEDKYILKYPTFNITMPEVVKEVSKEAVDSYLAGEHTGEELMTYANYGFGNPKIILLKKNQIVIFEEPSTVDFQKY